MNFILFAGIIFISSFSSVSGLSRYRTWYPTNSKVSYTLDTNQTVWIGKHLLDFGPLECVLRELYLKGNVEILIKVSFQSRIKSRKSLTGIHMNFISYKRKSFIIYEFYLHYDHSNERKDSSDPFILYSTGFPVVFFHNNVYVFRLTGRPEVRSRPQSSTESAF